MPQEPDGGISYRVIGLIGLFVASIVAAYLPTASQRYTFLRIPRLAFFLAKHFGTGVILSTAFTHLLNDAFRNLSNVQWFGYQHWAGLIVMLSIIAIFLVEYTSSAYLQYMSRRRADAFAQSKYDTEARPHSNGNGNGHLVAPPGEHTPLLRSEDEDSNEEDSAPIELKEQILAVGILQVGIMLHSIVIGLTMAVANAAHFASLLPAIFFHQIFEGLALGVRLASLASPSSSHPGHDHDTNESHDSESDEQQHRYSRTPSSTATSPSSSPTLSKQYTNPPTPNRARRILPPILAIIFAIPIPFILFISLFMPNLRTPGEDTSAPSDPDNHGIFPHSTRSSSSSYTYISQALALEKRGVVLQGVTSAISAGLLIYVSCVELLAGDFVHDPRMQKSSFWMQVGAVGAFVLGAVGMGFVG